MHRRFDERAPLQMANLCWWYYISKLTEFADTVFFVLRKKDSQVTLLHLYHHSLTPLETWILVKFLAGKLSKITEYLCQG
jgi:elongation of very long chain fatty acids protein 7